jgi:hypothetical protein
MKGINGVEGMAQVVEYLPTKCEALFKPQYKQNEHTNKKNKCM